MLNSDLANKFGIVKTTTLSGAGGFYVQFPSGFNSANCIISSIMIYKDGVWFNNANPENISFGIRAAENDIYIYQNSDYDFMGCVCWIVLMCID